MPQQSTELSEFTEFTESAQAQEAQVRVQLRLDDLSPSGHVGNTAVVRVLDEARMLFLGRPAPGRPGYRDGLLEVLGADARMFVGRQTVEYAAELWLSREPVTVRMRITHIGRSSFVLASELTAPGSPSPAVLAEAVIVLVDPHTRRPRPIDATVRRHFARHLGPPLRLRPYPGA